MLSFLNKYKWYRDADRRWHLNELDKQLDIVSLPLRDDINAYYNI